MHFLTQLLCQYLQSDQIDLRPLSLVERVKYGKAERRSLPTENISVHAFNIEQGSRNHNPRELACMYVQVNGSCASMISELYTISRIYHKLLPWN